jgi:hypothetical protein
VSKETIWRDYLHGKQTVKDISSIHGISESTVKRHLRGIREYYVCDKLPKRGIVLMDTTYWGRNWGLLIMLDSESSRVLWRKYVSHERLCDYKEGIDYLRKQGYEIKGIVCDGLRGIFQLLSEYPVQMCQFHQVAIIRRYITQTPKLEAGKELKSIAKLLTKTDKETFIEALEDWENKWEKFLKERTTDFNTGKSRYVHKKLRSAWLSLRRNIAYLFVFQKHKELNMPNTNNALEGTFTALKNSLRNHSGMSKENRKRFIDGFFKA